MIKVGIVGGTGYTGVELLRLLAVHPDVVVTAITSRGEAGRPVAELFPNLRGHFDLCFTDPAAGDLDEDLKLQRSCRLRVGEVLVSLTVAS